MSNNILDNVKNANESLAQAAGSSQLKIVESVEELLSKVTLPEPVQSLVEQAKGTASSMISAAHELPEVPEPFATFVNPWIEAYKPLVAKFETAAA